VSGPNTKSESKGIKGRLHGVNEEEGEKRSGNEACIRKAVCIPSLVLGVARRSSWVCVKICEKAKYPIKITDEA